MSRCKISQEMKKSSIFGWVIEVSFNLNYYKTLFKGLTDAKWVTNRIWAIKAGVCVLGDGHK